MEEQCVWRWTGLGWTKIVNCSGGSQLTCPYPDGEVGGYVGDVTYTPCGGP